MQTEAEAHKAQKTLRSMKASLRSWMQHRLKMDRMVGYDARVANDRYPWEQPLANDLYRLLKSCGVHPLPNPDLRNDPDAAVKLADMVDNCTVAGSSQTATGIVWWMLAIPVAAVVMVLATWIKSRADLAKEQERLRCIQAGHCTDHGPWLKYASIGVIGWLAWEKAGLKEAVAKL